jgi:hypothetical protein
LAPVFLPYISGAMDNTSRMGSGFRATGERGCGAL